MTDRKKGMQELLKFFVPLGITWSLMMFTHTIISAGLSRTTNPTVSTAAYAVALSLAAIAEAPLVMLRQTVMANVSSKQTFLVVRAVALTTLAFFAAVVLSIAYVPAIGRLAFQQILGVKDELFSATVLAFRVTMFLPLVSGLRCLYQGLITQQRRTKYLSTGMFIRVGFMIFLVFGFTRWRWVVGPLVGAIALVGGIGVEGLMAYYFGRNLVPEGDATLVSNDVWKFYLPLVASSLLVAMGKPFINAGLARMPDAAVGLAAFNVASSLAWVIVSPSQTMHQVTMVCGRSVADRPVVRHFATIFAVGSTLLLMALAYSPIGRWVLGGLISVPTESLPATLNALRTLAFFPLIICWQEYNTGLLLLDRSTRLVSIGKALNLASTIGFVIFLAPTLPGAIAAPLAQLVGFTCEGIVLHGGRLWLAKRWPAPSVS